MDFGCGVLVLEPAAAIQIFHSAFDAAHLRLTLETLHGYSRMSCQPLGGYRPGRCLSKKLSVGFTRRL